MNIPIEAEKPPLGGLLSRLERSGAVSGVLLSHGLRRSTIGDGGLSFRVRNGTGRTPSSMAADRAGALPVRVSPPATFRAAQRSEAV